MFRHKNALYKVTQHFDCGDDILGYILIYEVGSKWEVAYFQLLNEQEYFLDIKHTKLWLQGIKDFFVKGEDRDIFAQNSTYSYEETAIAEFLTHKKPKLRAFAKKYLSKCSV